LYESICITKIYLFRSKKKLLQYKISRLSADIVSHWIIWIRKRSFGHIYCFSKSAAGVISRRRVQRLANSTAMDFLRTFRRQNLWIKKILAKKETQFFTNKQSNKCKSPVEEFLQEIKLINGMKDQLLEDRKKTITKLFSSMTEQDGLHNNFQNMSILFDKSWYETIRDAINTSNTKRKRNYSNSTQRWRCNNLIAGKSIF
jgi:hypothetical protein